MELPVLPFKIPELALPFDIPVLMHPPVDHLVIALPLIVLLLEIVNLVVKKRAVGVISFFLLLFTIIGAVAAYYTGITDGKEALDLLTQAGQDDLKAHKLMGTYLMFASVAVLVFKLLASMIKRGIVKGLYFLILVLFVAGIVKQGKEGGELVYKYGANVARVAELQGTLDRLKKGEAPADEKKSAEEVKPVKEEKAVKKVEKPVKEEKAVPEKTDAEEKKVEEVSSEKAVVEATSAATESPKASVPEEVDHAVEQLQSTSEEKSISEVHTKETSTEEPTVEKTEANLSKTH
jgi:uncharacterized membrane protein